MFKEKAETQFTHGLGARGSELSELDGRGSAPHETLLIFSLLSEATHPWPDAPLQSAQVPQEGGTSMTHTWPLSSLWGQMLHFWPQALWPGLFFFIFFFFFELWPL